MKILFVCKHNRFRSKIAEAYFKKINKKDNISSAGIFKGIPIAKTTIAIAKEFGLNLNKKTSAINEEEFKKIDVIVIVANDVPKSIFKNKVKKIIKIKINDNLQSNKTASRKKVKQIIKYLNKLNKKLESAK